MLENILLNIRHTLEKNKTPTKPNATPSLLDLLHTGEFKYLTPVPLNHCSSLH